MGAGRGRGPLEEGSPAPEIRLRDVNGQERSLSQFLESGATLVALFKISCPTCQFTFPYLQRLSAGKLQVVGISQDEPEWTREFNRDFGVTFPTLIDEAVEGHPVSNAFGIAHVPSLFLIQPDGRISWTVTGFSRKGLEELGELAGVKVFRPEEKVPEWRSG